MSRTVIALVASLLLLALAAPAAAKERAVTTFDSLPGQFVAGVTYALGYTIRMDGVEPLKVERTDVVARSAGGKSYSFAGLPDGAPGHYVASVTFPTAGSYEWSVTQGSYFAPMQLPSITVAAAPVSAPAAGGGAPDPLGTALPLGVAALAAALALAIATRRARVPRIA